MTTDRTATTTGQAAGQRTAAGTAMSASAAIHPRFLRSGPWALSSVVALLFGLSFATSYAALYDYAQELGFAREFAIAFPLVLDAVIIVLAVTLLLERALGRRTMTIFGWRLTVRLPTWPMLSLWAFFAGSVAGNVGHAPNVLAAQLVAAVPPVSAALTFHLLLRLLDRAPALRAIAETYDERGIDEQERAAARKARRARIKTGRHSAKGASASADVSVSENGHDASAATRDHHHSDRDDQGATGEPSASSGSARKASKDKLRKRVQAAIEAGEPVTGEAVGEWLGLSARTGRRRLAALLRTDPDLAGAVGQEQPH